MTHRHSHLRIFAKSLHVLAAGWVVAVAWLWMAGLRQHVRRHDVLPADYGMATLITGTISAVIIELLAIAFVRLTGVAATHAIQRREWMHAFWWAAFPNLLILYTVYVLIFGID